MRLAFLSNWDSPHFQRWAVALDSGGHEIHVVTQHHDAPAKGNVQLHKLPFKGPIGYFLNVPFVRTIVSSIKPDLVHAHYATGYGTLGRFSSKHPFVISVYGDDIYIFPEKSAVHRLLVAQNLRAADWVCSTSKNMVDRLLQLNLNLRNVSVIPFGIDTTKFCPQLKPQGDHHITIGVVKLLLPDAGIDIVIKAVRKVIEDLKQVNLTLAKRLRLLIVGSGYEFFNLVSLTKQLDLDKITEFVPQVSHGCVADYFKRMDIYCALSRRESFGVAALEASACELPVVASRCGGLQENHLDGKTALFVNNEDVRGTAKAILQLVRDPHLRSELGRNGRKHVIQNFEWSHCVKMQELEYLTLLEKS